MSEIAQYRIGAKVTCSDGACGEPQRVVVDPVARALTHLVVEAEHSQGHRRLVPIEQVKPTAEEINLRCTAAEFRALEAAEATQFLPGPASQMGCAAGQTLLWLYYGLGGGMGGMGAIGIAAGPRVIVKERVPAGEVEIRRDEHVHASDGDIGGVQGLAIDTSDHAVTHVLFQEGHLWDEKQIAIPIGAVKDVDADGVQLNLTRDRVADLPPVDLARHA